jgi:hypothetical protein
MLRFLLRAVGSLALLALPCALMPERWMNAVHQRLGMGEWPAAPIVGYLARSVSAFYAMFGGLLWVLSTDVRRYGLLLRGVGAAFAVFGLFLVLVGSIEGLPSWWWLTQGPSYFGIGAAILLLSRGCSKHDQLEPGDAQGRGD